MKIDEVDRKFLKRKSRDEWLALLSVCRVVSIRSSFGWDSAFPVPPGVRPHRNLLCMTFDDTTELDDWSERELPVLFDSAKAKDLVNFVRDGSLPLVVQCTAGISRSGAIGTAFDEFFNVRDGQNPADHEYFTARNPQVRPNPLVLRLMREALCGKNG